MHKLILLLCLLVMVGGMSTVLTACAGKTVVPDAMADAAQPPEMLKSEKLAQRALEMLTPGTAAFNPEKGRAFLEHALRRGDIKELEVPAPVLLELLRSERIARKKSRTLEQQLTNVKEIDLEREGKL